MEPRTGTQTTQSQSHLGSDTPERWEGDAHPEWKTGWLSIIIFQLLSLWSNYGRERGWGERERDRDQRMRQNFLGERAQNLEPKGLRWNQHWSLALPLTGWGTLHLQAVWTCRDYMGIKWTRMYFANVKARYRGQGFRPGHLWWQKAAPGSAGDRGSQSCRVQTPNMMGNISMSVSLSLSPSASI